MGCNQTKAAEPVGESESEQQDNLADVINPAPLSALYELGEIIGQSSTSVVHLATRRADGARVAVKMLPKSSGDARPLGSDFVREVRIMLRLRHAHVLGLLDVFDEPSRAALVLELCRGGDLHDLLSRSGGGLKEDETRNVMYQLLSAIAYLHDEGIIHRDLKLENVLMTTKSARALVKLSDFGFAKRTDALAIRGGGGAVPSTQRQKKRDTVLGTLEYMAPELAHRGNYDVHVDVYACGIIMYALLAGRLPFEMPAQSTRQKKRGSVAETANSSGSLPSFTEPECAGISDEARMMICEMLNPNWRKRPSAKVVLEHAWMKLGHISVITIPEEGHAVARTSSGAHDASPTAAQLPEHAKESPALAPPPPQPQPKAGSVAAYAWLGCGEGTSLEDPGSSKASHPGELAQ